MTLQQIIDEAVNDKQLERYLLEWSRADIGGVPTELIVTKIAAHLMHRAAQAAIEAVEPEDPHRAIVVIVGGERKHIEVNATFNQKAAAFMGEPVGEAGEAKS